MASWVGFLIALVIIVAALARQGRRRLPDMGHVPLIRIDGGREPVARQQPQTADDSTADICRDPNLEYQGEVYFFCSIEERDTCTANLQLGEFHPKEAGSFLH